MNKIKGLSDSKRAYIAGILDVAVKEIYQAGFEDGQASLTVEVKALTANQQRAQLIQRAREFVENTHGTGAITKRGGFNLSNYTGLCDAEFVVNSEKRTVVCLLREQMTNELYTKGIAKCMPGDVFNEWIGKAIALAKALKIDIPQEFMDAVQPDKKVIGMLLRSERDYPSAQFGPLFKGHISRVVEEVKQHRIECMIDSPLSKSSTIIDDTNAEYEFESVGEQQ